MKKIEQAFVLAGGEGSRLKPITEKIPKPMVEIQGRPFLEHHIELLAKNGISEVVLGVGYLWEQFKDHFGEVFTSKSGSKISLKYSVEPRFLGTGGALKLAENLLDDYFFITYGDSVLPIDYQQLGQRFFETGVIGIIAVYSNKDKIANNNVTINKKNFIIKYDKNEETPDMNGVEAGVLVFNKKVLDYLPDDIPKNQKISLEVDIYPKLIEQRQLLGYLTDIRFYDMGTFERIKIINEVLK